ncbi:hypothetical protein [Pelagibacterium lacus]|uniref:Uncharacterized protein n=1 Tax=Pelagibacterium lacus TaxID=2282655 RepID=A0A369W1R7_9HYPH|nr:hypothetical protein [Pelagibacterium lacus]RDE07897.1 hypothetical protein DVH29_14190 [Pelagibacterium lacus]
MTDIIHWPAELLAPQSSPFDLRPFSRTGGRSLGGLSRSTRTDRGWWIGSYNNIVFRRTNFDQARTWNALRVAIGGASGLVAVPVCSTALWAGLGISDFSRPELPHDDDTFFDDDTGYTQGNVLLEMASFAALGSTVVTLRLIDLEHVSGVRFSYQHAMYETGRVLAQPTSNTYQVEIFPAIRAPIPANAILEAERPTVLCHLASDSEMDRDPGLTGTGRASVNFVEAVDFWNDLALGLV